MRQSGIEYRLLDAGRIQPVPNAVLRALSALELAEDTSLASALANRGRFILLIDNYHTLYMLHDWLCETGPAPVPASTIVVVASRARSLSCGAPTRRGGSLVHVR